MPDSENDRDEGPRPPLANDDLATDQCPQCGTHVDLADGYCRTCGAVFTPDASAARDR